MKRSILIASGAVVLVLLLAGAAFVGGRLLSAQDQTGGNEEIVTTSGSGEGGKVISEKLEFQEADELPDASSDFVGSFVRREDNSLFISQFGANGLETEVVVTHDTPIYEDVTAKQFTDGMPSGPIQQVLSPVSLDEIGQGSIIRVWGEKRGDRVTAELIMYNVPVMIGR